MRRINFNIKDRKLLYGVLSIVLVCVFTLSIAYAALSVTLNIQGSAQVTSADWNIHFANPVVTNGSVTTNVPTLLNATTVDFNTTLSMPGDFYEFSVDIVNDGSIDAVIDGINKIPELTSEQAKYLKYEVSYNDGSSVSEQKSLLKKSTDTVKVRIEFRKDISSSDLPTSQVILDLSLTFNYLQSDDSSVSGGLSSPHVTADGDINEIGTIVTIGTEQFYTIGTEGDNVKLFAMYNLHVGNKVTKVAWSGTVDPVFEPIANPTGIQDSTALGYYTAVNTPFFGTFSYPVLDFDGDVVTYEGSQAKIFVDNYKTYLETFDVIIVDARIISYDELVDPNTFACEEYGECNSDYPWITSTSYWTSTIDPDDEWSQKAMDNGYLGSVPHMFEFECGARPVIVIPKGYF